MVSTGTRNYIATFSLTATTRPTVVYVNSYTLNKDGTISIVNPTTFTLQYTSSCNALKGKYYQVGGEINSYTVGYLSPSAVIQDDNYNDVGYIMASNASLYSFGYKSVYVEPTDGWTLIASADRNTYPDDGSQDGFVYKYRGVPFDNALSVQFASGSFAGTGGAITLNFEFNPKIVIIQTVGTSDHTSATFIAMRGNSKGLIKCLAPYTNYVDTAAPNVTWGDKSMTTAAALSLSAAGVTHQYIAFG